MTDEVKDVSDMQAICNALVINIGTLNHNSVEAMIAAGKKANELGHFVVLDPCGVGATPYRNEVIDKLIKEIKFDCIKGNISEIKALANVSAKTKGVDASEADKVTKENLDEVFKFAKKLSNATGAVIAITGAIDVITDSKNAYICTNGCKEMSKITGTGCMSAGIVAAGIVANQNDKLKAVTYSVALMGLAGEEALKFAKGTGSLHIGLIDMLSNITDKELEVGAKIEKFEI